MKVLCLYYENIMIILYLLYYEDMLIVIILCYNGDYAYVILILFYVYIIILSWRYYAKAQKFG